MDTCSTIAESVNDTCSTIAESVNAYSSVNSS